MAAQNRVAIGISTYANTSWWLIEWRGAVIDLLSMDSDLLATLAKTGRDVEEPPADVPCLVEIDFERLQVTLVGSWADLGCAEAPSADDLARLGGSAWSDLWTFRWSPVREPREPLAAPSPAPPAAPVFVPDGLQQHAIDR